MTKDAAGDDEGDKDGEEDGDGDDDGLVVEFCARRGGLPAGWEGVCNVGVDGGWARTL